MLALFLIILAVLFTESIAVKLDRVCSQEQLEKERKEREKAAQAHAASLKSEL